MRAIPLAACLLMTAFAPAALASPEPPDPREVIDDLNGDLDELWGDVNHTTQNAVCVDNGIRLHQCEIVFERRTDLIDDALLCLVKGPVCYRSDGT